MLSFSQVLSPKAVDHVVMNMPPVDVMPSILVMNRSLKTIQDLERPMRKELEKLCTSIVYNNFPIFLNNKPHVKVRARLVEHILSADQEGPINKPEFRPELLHEYRKRKLINMITQGAGISTHGIHHLSEDFKQHNADLVAAYDVFDQHNRSAMRMTQDQMALSMPEEGMSSVRVLGMVKVEHIHGKWVIDAQAVLMPVLIHEIVKGMYELMAMDGLPDDIHVRKNVLEVTDTKVNELLDCKYGETIYPLVRDWIRGNFHDITDERPEVQEYYLQHLYKQGPIEMIHEIERMIMGKLDPKTVRIIMDDIYKDMKRDDYEASIQ